MHAAAYAIVEFSRLHRISRAHLYNLIKRGEGPILMKVGNVRSFPKKRRSLGADEWKTQPTPESLGDYAGGVGTSQAADVNAGEHWRAGAKMHHRWTFRRCTKENHRWTFRRCAKEI